MSERLSGRIVSASFEDGEPGRVDCGLDDCECPMHDEPVLPAGTYVTVRLDEDHRIGPWNVIVEVPHDA